MPLTPGTRLGPYEVSEQLGAGGMGEVYRATDSNLRRWVALKVLPSSVARDAERLARFQREAEVLAALNHPNIAAIYGLEKTPDYTALVMELVEGEDLSTRISRGAIPLDEALPIAKQIADALEVAHEQGIIHRDLKPANIKVRADGTVKVLDFGLAKMLDQSTGSGLQTSGNLTAPPTLTSPAHMTGVGIILGTAAYMAPEQARGKIVDKRADIWAFGAVLFEMLTGTQPFPGEDVSHVLARVIERDPNFDALPSSVPARVAQVIRLCLRKDPKQRAADIRDVRLALDGAFETVAQSDVPASKAHASGRRVAWGIAAAALFAAALLVVPAVRHLRETTDVQPSYRFEIAPPRDSRFTMFRLSPDGRSIAYIAAGQGLWIRPLDALESRQIPGSEGATYPFWSPDSAFVGFFQGGKLKKVATAGGPAQTICDVADARGGTWGPDGTILFTDGAKRPLFRVPSSGGKPTQATTLPAGTEGHRWPEFLPDGQHFTMSATANDREHAGMMLGALDGSAPVRLGDDDSDSVFSQGHLFFLRALTLMALPFDPVARKATGEAFPVVENVGIAANVRYGAFSVASNGTLVYRTGGAESARELVWMDRAGKRINALGEARAFSDAPALSPDEKTVAASVAGAPGSPAELWLLDSSNGRASRFTFGAGGRSPVWSPDGRTIVYARPAEFANDIVRKPLAGGAEEVLLGRTTNATPSDVSPDGKRIAHNVNGENTAMDIGLLAADGNHSESVYLNSPANQRRARFSPDGKWMLYESDETGRAEIYVQTIPAGGGKFLISSSGGREATWRRDGKELYYLDPAGKLMAVPVKINGTSFGPGAPQALFTATGATTFVATRDGQRFLVNVPAGGESGAAAPPLTVVTNWQAGLKK